MTRLLCLLFVMLSTVAPLEAADPQQTERLRERLASGVLHWGGDAEGGAPYQLRDPHDPAKVIGFEVEIADAIAGSLGQQLGIPLRAEFVQYEWVSLVPGLEKKDFDIILAGFEATEDNRNQIRFSRPYYGYAQQLVVRSADESIHTLADCRDRRVGTLAGSKSAKVLEDAGVKQIVGFEGQIEPYIDLELERVDAVLLDMPIYLFCAARNDKLKLAGPGFAHGVYQVGSRLDDPDLAAGINDALSTIMQNGQLRDILRRWHLWNADQKELAIGSHRAAELAGLGFNAAGEALPERELPPVEPVNRDMFAASAKLWTIDRYGPLLLKAAAMTVFLTVTSMATAMLIGLVVALGRLYAPAPVRWLALGYVEFFRGIPLLLVLTFLYFGLPTVTKAYPWLSWLEMNAIVTAIVAFGLIYGAYESEIYRSAIESIPRGQWEAARALGMRESLAFWRIIFPQGLRTALGPMTNDFVALFKDTSLVSVIAVRELTKEYQLLSRSSLKFVELGLLTAALYLIMSLPLGHLSRRLEQRWGPKR